MTGGPVAVGADAALPYTVAENTLLDNYDITVIPGSIEITRRPVTLTAPSGTFNYSAAEHALLIDKVTSPKNMGFLADVGEVRVQFATLADGTPSNTRRVPGTQSVTLDPASVTLVPAEGFESVDLPAQYEITLEPGLLTVNAKAGAVGLTLRALDAAGVDAFIIGDVGAFAVAGEVAPRVERHVSTQASVANGAAARVWHSLGASRVVCAREMSLTDIARLRQEAPPDLEIEAFAHGAMCMAVSGRCLISSYLTGRSGNKGHCTQPCRWSYQLGTASPAAARP